MLEPHIPLSESKTKNPIEVKIPLEVGQQLVSRASAAYSRYNQADLHFVINRGGRLAFNVLSGLTQIHGDTDLMQTPNTVAISTGRYLIDAFTSEAGIQGDFFAESEEADQYLIWLRKKAVEPEGIVADVVEETMANFNQKHLPESVKNKKSLTIMLIDDVRQHGITADFTTATIIEIVMNRLGLSNKLEYQENAYLASSGWDEAIIRETFADFFKTYPARNHILEILGHLARGEYRFSEGVRVIQTADDFKKMCQAVTDKWKWIRENMREHAPKEWSEFKEPSSDLIEAYGENELLGFHQKFITALQELGKKA